MAQAVLGQPAFAGANLKWALEDAQFAGENPPAPEIARPRAIAARAMPASAQQVRTIAKIQAMAGDVETALTTAHSITDSSWKQWALADVIQCRAMAGEPLEALSLSRRMDSVTDRRSALEHLADGTSQRLELEEGWKQVNPQQHKP
jgi:hypothetical protein